MTRRETGYLLALAAVVAVLILGIFIGKYVWRGPVLSHQNPGVSREAVLPQTQQKVNINTADRETLCTLPGIGRTLASRIIAYREENGNFIHPAQLLQVEGIGEVLLENLLAYIAVGG